ncbi:uncharacterized protein TRIADDRAFT_56334 [Trichoplax adhaerens]|uniref:Uncharacterized protein n=1 Tax=Trichoplax adhaerens TaxID=10228 RepID=B3RXU5_TRIAD|nr:hypothetical protein TRIADDRAFT_56334 [Trichoplax adhaerens]EDV24492.1 hypothetical protein TRIADDRAFT_56334 [Trichoplax adhaerens]|eukprot:XP_002112382.1 hypothetical protein TRIADDRAFT_56334 [Trichoplax adhaerens]
MQIISTIIVCAFIFGSVSTRKLEHKLSKRSGYSNVAGIFPGGYGGPGYGKCITKVVATTTLPPSTQLTTVIVPTVSTVTDIRRITKTQREIFTMTNIVTDTETEFLTETATQTSTIEATVPVTLTEVATKTKFISVPIYRNYHRPQAVYGYAYLTQTLIKTKLVPTTSTATQVLTSVITSRDISTIMLTDTLTQTQTETETELQTETETETDTVTATETMLLTQTETDTSTETETETETETQVETSISTTTRQIPTVVPTTVVVTAYRYHTVTVGSHKGYGHGYGSGFTGY